jgi:hypothetical protein
MIERKDGCIGNVCQRRNDGAKNTAVGHGVREGLPVVCRILFPITSLRADGETLDVYTSQKGTFHPERYVENLFGGLEC